MAARSRPRSSFTSEDIGGESQLWSSIVDKIKRCHAINQKYESLSKSLASSEEQVKNSSAKDAISKLEELEKLYREGIKLSEEEVKILNEEPDDLLRNLETLISVRSALEAETPRATTQPKPRTLKRSRPDIDGTLDSPTPAPEMSTPVSASRSLPKQASRSGSVASAVPVKVENGSEQLESIKGVASLEKPKFAIGAEVFYRHKGKDREGEGIQCRVTNVIGDGKQRRYEIQDIDPDAQEQTPHRASVQSLVAIPRQGTPLPELQKGKQVFALYPATTTFYKAEVVRSGKEWCRLRFEGEEEKNKEQDVRRHHILDAK